MQRRALLAAIAKVAAAAGVSPAARALTDSPTAASVGASATTTDAWAREFNAALANKPWLLGYRSASASSFNATAKTQGQWPKELSGTLYRNGPAQHEVGNFRYRHWFAGDGMVQSFNLQDGQVQHQAKLVETRKVTDERAAGRALYPGFASTPPNPAPVTGPDSVNVANISVLPHHGKLFALWEAGSPYEMDAATLATKGRHVFSKATDGVPFSAHPRVEPNGTLWNFGYLSSAALLVFWHIDATGKLQKAGTVKVDPMTMPHDFVVTSRHLVILLPPLHYLPGDNHSFLDSHQWQPQDPTRVLVVDKNDFSKTQWFELPAQWVFHFGNAWEDNAGVIHFDGARANNPDAMLETFREIMRGRVVPGAEAMHYQYQLDTRSGRARERAMLARGVNSEFPTINPSVSTLQNQYLYCMTADAQQPAPHHSLDCVSRYDYKTEKLDTYRYPPTKIPEEHLFVPKPGAAGEGQGWLLGTALDYAAKATELNLFDAQNIAAGPIANATLPYALPLGLHGKFLATSRR